jgi:replicative DNA helicase
MSYPDRAQMGRTHLIPGSEYQPEEVWGEEEFLKQALSDEYPEEQAEILRMLRPEHFFIRQHGRIIAAAQALERRQAPLIDFYTVADELDRCGDLEGVGGRERIVGLQNIGHAPSVRIAAYYADLIRKAAELRELADLREKITGWIAETDEPAAVIRQRIVGELLKAEDPEAANIVTLGDALAAEVARIHQRQEIRTLKFGLPGIDRLTGGLEAGEVGLVCGQPGTGKTCFTLMQALHAAATWGTPCVVSLEMGEPRLARRLLAGTTGLSFGELRATRRRTGEPFTESDLQAVDHAGQAGMADADKVILETKTFRLEDLIGKLRFYKVRRNIQAVIIDYGQLVHARGGRDTTRTEELSLIARALKNEIAMPLNVPVWCLVQPNRNVKGRDTKDKPALLQMGDIFGASEWEAVANQIWFLNRDPAFPKQVDKQETDTPILLEIAKSRDDQTGFVPLTLFGERFLFGERDTRHGEPEKRPFNELRERRREWSGERDDGD